MLSRVCVEEGGTPPYPNCIGVSECVAAVASRNFVNPLIRRKFSCSAIVQAVAPKPTPEAATMGFSSIKACLHTPTLHASNTHKSTLIPKPPRKCSLGGSSRWSTGWPQQHEGRSWKVINETWKARALPDWRALSDCPLMAVMVEHIAGQRDYVVHKSVWHMSDETLKAIYTMYIMFTCWGCCFFGSTKDPFYDGEQYRKDGGDGTVNWLYERQDDIEESARAELWREELIEEIEQKVGGLRELEEAGKQEELVK